MDDEELDEFFKGRTIGYDAVFGWAWRGQGYDEGWNIPTPEELTRLKELMNKHV